jgi:hypothetical protein
VHVRCRCGPGDEVSIVVTDQGKGLISKRPWVATSHRGSLPCTASR